MQQLWPSWVFLLTFCQAVPAEHHRCLVDLLDLRRLQRHRQPAQMLLCCAAGLEVTGQRLMLQLLWFWCLQTLLPCVCPYQRQGLLGSGLSASSSSSSAASPSALLSPAHSVWSIRSMHFRVFARHHCRLLWTCPNSKICKRWRCHCKPLQGFSRTNAN